MTKSKAQLLDEVHDLEKIIKSISKKLPCSEKLRLLAKWIDKKYPDDIDPEAQNDLRKWADNIDKIIKKIKGI